MPVIAYDIEKQIGSHTILKDVSVRVEKGRITVVAGPSGSGKTSLIRAMSLLDPPTKGEIQIDGTKYHFPADGTPMPKPWPKLTVVFQQLFLWPHLSLRGNIELPLRKSLDQPTREHVESLIDEFEMRDWVDRHPNEVSNGQRQRAAIVRALCLRPSYILFDEITSALDVEQINKVHNQMLELRERGIGILLVTHMLDFAVGCADHVVFMDDGKVVESGDATILKKPETKRLRQFLFGSNLG